MDYCALEGQRQSAVRMAGDSVVGVAMVTAILALLRIGLVRHFHRTCSILIDIGNNKC